MDWESQVKTASVFSLLSAVWMIVSPYVMGFTTLGRVVWWTVLIASVVVFILSAIRLFMPHGTTMLSWINALVGLGLIASPFVWYLTGDVFVMWDFIIVGIAYIVFNLWAALADRITL